MAAFLSSALAAAGGLKGAATILGAASGVASVATQITQGRKIEAAQDKAANLQKAQEKIKNKVARQQTAREERIRRARLLSSATVGGGGQGSSSFVGATSALGSNFATSMARQAQESRFAQSMSGINQGIANSESRIYRAGAINKLVQQGISFGTEMEWF